MSKLRWTLSLLASVTVMSVALGAERAPTRDPGRKTETKPTDRGREPGPKPETRQPAPAPPVPAAETPARRPPASYGGPNSSGSPAGYGAGYGGGYGASYGNNVTSGQYAEAVIDHANPQWVSAEIGTVDGMVHGIPLVFVDEGVDIVRSARGSSVGRADLRNWTQFLDGRHEWYLRITDRSGQGGVLKSFTVVTPGGSQQIRQVPTAFAGGRVTEARLTPLAAGGYGGGTYVPAGPLASGYSGGGYAPAYGGSYVPAPAASYAPAATARVTARLPRVAPAGGLVAIDLDVDLCGGYYGRLGVVWELPAGWYIARLEPASSQSDSTATRAVWRIDSPPQRLRLRVLAVAPQGCSAGGDVYEMDGQWKVDGSPILPIAGDSQVLVGAPVGHDYDRHGFHPAPRQALDGILRKVLGQ